MRGRNEHEQSCGQPLCSSHLLGKAIGGLETVKAGAVWRTQLFRAKPHSGSAASELLLRGATKSVANSTVASDELRVAILISQRSVRGPMCQWPQRRPSPSYWPR